MCPSEKDCANFCPAMCLADSLPFDPGQQLFAQELTK